MYRIAALYPLAIDPIAQQAYLKASNTGAGDQFGHSVAVAGPTVVVGAFGEDSSATGVNGDQSNNSAGDSGAAYLFSGLESCPGDADGSGTIDVQDLVAVTLAWGLCGECPQDVNGDGFVNVQDLIEVIVNWGPCG